MSGSVTSGARANGAWRAVDPLGADAPQDIGDLEYRPDRFNRDTRRTTTTPAVALGLAVASGDDDPSWGTGSPQNCSRPEGVTPASWPGPQS